MANPAKTRVRKKPDAHQKLVARLIPPAEMKPNSIDEVTRLPSFFEKIKTLEEHFQTSYAAIDHSSQNALVLRRLQQMLKTLMLNPVWSERIRKAGLEGGARDLEEWQNLPISDREDMRHLFMGSRPGMVVPLNHGGFEVVASCGTRSGEPVETVYTLSELQDTYKLVGDFMSEHVLADRLAGDEPEWAITSLADYLMWSSGTIAGGWMQRMPSTNFIAGGPLRMELFQHILSYEGKKAFVALSHGIAILVDHAQGLDKKARESLHVALYVGGVLPHRKRVELEALYPNLKILSYFSTSKAEAVGVQQTPDSYLAAIPGLHLVEIVDEQGRWVKEGEEGELVVTRLHGHAAPFPRLKLGDRAIRRPDLDVAGLNTQQFELAGRSCDVIGIGRFNCAASRVYTSLCRELLATHVFDLKAMAHEVQFLNNRKAETLTLIVAVDVVEWATMRLGFVLGPYGVRHLFKQAIFRSLDDPAEASFESLETASYDFQIRFVLRGSLEIYRTEFGKVPLLKDFP